MIRTIPVRLETCDVPAEFRRFHWIDLFDEGGIERLVRAIRVGLAQRQQEPIPPPEAPAAAEPTTSQPDREPTQPSNDARIVPPEERTPDFTNTIGMEFMLIPADSFMQGRLLIVEGRGLVWIDPDSGEQEW